VSNNVYRVIKVVGSSASGSDHAIENAIARANETIKHIDWFEVVETRGHVDDRAIAHYHVTLKIGFSLEH